MQFHQWERKGPSKAPAPMAAINQANPSAPTRRCVAASTTSRADVAPLAKLVRA
jgi:hypothetical protein